MSWAACTGACAAGCARAGPSTADSAWSPGTSMVRMLYAAPCWTGPPCWFSDWSELGPSPSVCAGASVQPQPGGTLYAMHALFWSRVPCMGSAPGTGSTLCAAGTTNPRAGPALAVCSVWVDLALLVLHVTPYQTSPACWLCHSLVQTSLGASMQVWSSRLGATCTAHTLGDLLLSSAPLALGPAHVPEWLYVLHVVHGVGLRNMGWIQCLTPLL